MFEHYRYDGSEKFNISKVPTNDITLVKDRGEAEYLLNRNNSQIDELQQKLYAEKREGVIFLFQAMDAAGKDGTIRAVLQCLSPHGVHEAAFKSPSSEDLAHDFLWRIEKNVPAKGEIAIFNRSQYEEVLIYKVKELWKKQANAKRIKTENILEHRYEDIKNYEEYLWHNNVRTVKIFLNVSKKEQAKRFLDRIEEPEKHWKFSPDDLKERAHFEEYMALCEEVINQTATKHAPWYVIPADDKWYTRYLVSEIIIDTLKACHPRFPEASDEIAAHLDEYKRELNEE